MPIRWSETNTARRKAGDDKRLLGPTITSLRQPVRQAARGLCWYQRRYTSAPFGLAAEIGDRLEAQRNVGPMVHVLQAHTSCQLEDASGDERRWAFWFSISPHPMIPNKHCYGRPIAKPHLSALCTGGNSYKLRVNGILVPRRSLGQKALSAVTGHAYASRCVLGDMGIFDLSQNYASPQD
jgi:hypothetical protein